MLALEPWYGGSHRAFLDGWAAGSRHAFDILGLAPRHWKWRMRHAAVTFAEQVVDGTGWDVVWASSLLDLAAWRGLAPDAAARLPTVLYFHENQLTYPLRPGEPEAARDAHFGFTHLTSGLAADAVWWNSTFHRDACLEALDRFARAMPDHRPVDAAAQIAARSRIEPPGVELEVDNTRGRVSPSAGPLHIVWAARWEHDKDPEAFFAALDRLIDRGVEFRISVLGQRFREVPAVFAAARERLGARALDWGPLPRDAFLDRLASADVFVSTARHEFFGIAAVEAMASGAYPLLPDRLAYPELLERVADPAAHLFDGAPERQVASLADRLAALAERRETGSVWAGDPLAVARSMERFGWASRRARLDAALQTVAREA